MLAGRDLNKGSWVTDDKSSPNAWIPCQGCEGFIIFNKEEILSHKAAGQNTSTPCRHCGWHPGYPPEPWLPWPNEDTPPQMR